MQSNLPKAIVIATALLLVGLCSAQERITKETKVILVVDQKSDSVEHIQLLASFQKMNKKELKAKYTHHKFFLGVLRGTYDLDKNWILPGNNTTIVIYTEKQFASSEQFLKSDDLLPGDEFNLGKTATKVIANKKGELTLKTQ